MLSKGKDESTIRTFRLGNELDEVLKKEAERQSISVSALLNQIVLRYSDAERYFTRYNTLTIEKNTFISFIEGLSGEKVAEIGDLAGSRSLRNGLSIRGLNSNAETVRFIVEHVYGRYSGWFEANFYEKNDAVVYHLRHDLGDSWSTFVNHFMLRMFDSLLDTDVRTDVTEDSVTVYIPKNRIKR